MAPLIHRTKTTHCYSATEEHFQDFFATLTHMYEEQAHTDVHLVAKDGTLFGVHRVSFFLLCLLHMHHLFAFTDGPRRPERLYQEHVPRRRALRVQHAHRHHARL